MSEHRRVLPAFALLVVLLAAPARADRPLVTDSGDVPDRGTCKVESGYTRDRAGAGWGAELACVPIGVVEWGLSLGRSRTFGEALDDDLGLQAKIPVVAHDDDDPIALAITLSAGRTFGAAHGRSAFQHAGVNVPASLFLMNDRLRLDANVGLAKSYADERVVTWGAAADYDLLPSLGVVAEVYRAEPGRPRFTLGARWHVVPEQFDVVVGVGRRFGGDDGGWLWTVGFKLESGTILR